MRPVHPGRILRREMQARKLSANALALALSAPSGRITDIVNGKRGVSPESALRLGRYFQRQRPFLAQPADELRAGGRPDRSGGVGNPSPGGRGAGVRGPGFDE